MELPNSLKVAYLWWRRASPNEKAKQAAYYSGALNVYLEMSKRPYETVMAELAAIGKSEDEVAKAIVRYRIKHNI